MLRNVRELVRQEHDPGRLRQLLEQADQAHRRAIVTREFGVGIVADQHHVGGRFADQPGAERASARSATPAAIVRCASVDERTAGRRQAHARMVGDDLGDAGAPPQAEKRIHLAAIGPRRDGAAGLECAGPVAFGLSTSGAPAPLASRLESTKTQRKRGRPAMSADHIERFGASR